MIYLISVSDMGVFTNLHNNTGDTLVTRQGGVVVYPV